MPTLTMGRVLWVGALSAAVLPAPAVPAPLAERLHARALDSFRQGRFPEAYGRFVGLANAGHPASARYALWMCEHGLALFGKDWDCAPHEVEDWALAAGVAVPRIVAARGVPSGAAKAPFPASAGRSPGAERPQRAH